ncbi:hypothetical protein E1B28_013430 [Marasmius oreades]|uniref:Uncharacterized protein n=1 Tax=Marasmius oreades TaxID=181124 RepID=A0A9P7RPJ9_9AGAR|nr:uncharacterized protein E1B28_013430 [Marasmius oreades]KAG7087464.1 hypothetical protein E1B28_013430 [Marasmius oreades]
MVKKGDLEDTIIFLDSIPEGKNIRINYDIIDARVHFNLRLAMSTTPHEAASLNWLRFLRTIWNHNFPNVEFDEAFSSTASATYRGESKGKSADCNVLPELRDRGIQVPSAVIGCLSIGAFSRFLFLNFGDNCWDQVGNDESRPQTNFSQITF